MAYQYGPVIAGVDDSSDSVGALRWAADEASRCTRTLMTVNVQPGPAPDKPAGPDIAERAAAEARRWRVSVAAVGETRYGEPVPVLRQLTGDASLLVVASRGEGGRTLGSVSEALGVRADCPVLIVHDARRWAPPDTALPAVDPVAVGFDGSDSARRALRLAFAAAARRASRLVVVQAWAHPELWHPGRHRGATLCTDEAAVHEALCEAAAPWRAAYPNVQVEVRSEPGDVIEKLAVVSQWAALLVLGTRCDHDKVQPPNPSVMRQVLTHAACPVLVAHGLDRMARPQAARRPTAAAGTARHQG